MNIVTFRVRTYEDLCVSIKYSFINTITIVYFPSQKSNDGNILEFHIMKNIKNLHKEL